MAVSFEGIPVDDELEVIALSGSSWRISDRRFPPASPGGVLAYVERDEYGYEVLLLGQGWTETRWADCPAVALTCVQARRPGALPAGAA